MNKRFVLGDKVKLNREISDPELLSIGLSHAVIQHILRTKKPLYVHSFNKDGVVVDFKYTSSNYFKINLPEHMLQNAPINNHLLTTIFCGNI